MNSLKLTRYFFEKISIVFPPFPLKEKLKDEKARFQADTTIYLSKKNPDRVAVKLNVLILPVNKRSKQPQIQFEASIIGIFKNLDKTKKIRFLAKKIAPQILYEILLEHSFKIINHSIVKDTSIPLKLPK